MTTHERIEAADLDWHVPPVCQGQMVVVAYAADGDQVYRRTTDTDGSVIYSVADWIDDAEWQPWSDEPEGFDWRTVRS